MNKQNVTAIPDENKIEELLSKLRPIPSEHFQQRMKRAMWQMKQRQQTAVKNFRLKITFAVITLATLIVFLVTPQGRAWAQEVMQFFRKINSNTIQLSDEQTSSLNELMYQVNQQSTLPLVPVFIPTVSPEVAAIAGCEKPQKAQSYHCRAALAESKLGFDLKELPEKPKGWDFQSLSYNTDSRSATMSYELDIQRFGGGSVYSSFMLTQGIGNFSKSPWFNNNPWEAVSADKVETVSVGTYQGEYVKGRFGLKPGSSVLIWSEETKEQRLAWSEGERWYLIEFIPNLNIANTMNKNDLIRLAQSLVTSPAAAAEPLNPAYLTSISDAEKISGLDLKAPTLLPMNIDFSYAHYFHDKQEVTLVYGSNEELTIHEREGEFNKPSGAYEIVHINGEEAYYDPAKSSESRSFLWWHKAGLNYQMSYASPFPAGNIDKEEMFLIAESMQDIDDFQQHGKKSYEQITIYAQALGLNIKKFPEAPAGWTFNNFWGEPLTQCLDLIYTSLTGQSTLDVDQCKTDKSYDRSILPSKAIEQVKVGNNNGQYTAGGFTLTDNGKLVWDSTLPVKRLYWQEDGLWMEITVSDDAALHMNKEDLIKYAESLK